MTRQETLNRLYENIEYLIKIKGYDKGRVETAIGVSVGYFSRSKAHNVDMPITTVMRIAEHFDIPIEFLLSVNYKKIYLESQIAELQAELQELQEMVGDTNG